MISQHGKELLIIDSYKIQFIKRLKSAKNGGVENGKQKMKILYILLHINLT